MVRLVTATGREIACDAVIRATNYNFLTIHTNALTRIEVDTIFDDPTETSVLTAYEQIYETSGDSVIVRETKRVYRNWTILDAVQKSPMYATPGELMIWLTKPDEDGA